MKFMNPHILYALAFLLIPIFVHLFKFRRFKKVDFSNVAFLSQVEKESRRNRRLKKYLVLLTRMLIFLFLVLAFARPYIPREQQKKIDYYLVFDNSLSTSYTESTGSIRADLLSDLQAVLNKNSDYKLLISNTLYEYEGEETVLKKVTEAGFSPFVFDHEAIINQLIRKSENKEIFYLTDGQFLTSADFKLIGADTLSKWHFIFKKPAFPANAWIDTLYLTSNRLESYEMNVVVASMGRHFDLAVELYTENNILYKRRFSLEKNKSDTLRFEIPKKHRVRYGKISLKGENNLGFDNDMYFKMPIPLTYNILIAGDEIPSFFETLYDHPNIQVNFVKPGKIPWDELENFDLIIFKGWKPFYNIDLIKRYTGKHKGKFIFIPDFTSNDQIFYASLGWPHTQSDTITRELVRIRYNHPFFRNVFKKKETNFRAPVFKSSYRLPSRTLDLLQLEGGRPLLVKQGNMFIFSSALGHPVSDFYLSPLVIPVFFKPLWMDSDKNSLYQYLTTDMKFPVKLERNSNKPLRLLKGDFSIIPYQEQHGQFTVLYPEDLIREAGIYYVVHQGDTVDVVALNYHRSESILKYFDDYGSLPYNADLFKAEKEGKQDHNFSSIDLGRFFLILALIFILIETLMLRFWKWD